MNRPFSNTWSRIALIAVGVFAIALALIGLNPWSLTPSTIEGSLKRSIAASTGLSLDSYREPRISFLPWPMLRISDAVLETQHAHRELKTRITAKQVKIRLNLYALATGKGTVSQVRLYQPHIALTDSDSADRLTPVFKALDGLLGGTSGQSFRRLLIADGRLDINGATVLTDLTTNISNQPGFGRSMTGVARFDGHVFHLKADLGSGVPAAASWSLTSHRFGLHFFGRRLDVGGLNAEGDLALSWSDGGDVARQLGIDEAFTRLSSSISLTSNARVLWPLVQLQDATINLETTKLTGAIDAALDELPARFSATLATDHLVLPGLRKQSGSSENAGVFSEPTRELDFVRGNADIRLSAARVTVGDLKLGESALSLSTRPDRLEAIISQSSLGSGSLKARTQIAKSQDQFRSRTTVSVDRMPAEIANLLFGAPLTGGSLTATVSHEGVGHNLNAMFLGGTGGGTASIANGQIKGIDMARLFARGDRPQTDALLPGGTTRIQSGTTKLRLADGRLYFEEGLLSNPLLRAPFDGSIDFARNDVALTVRILPPIDISRLGEAQLTISGPLAKPVIKHEWKPSAGRT